MDVSTILQIVQVVAYLGGATLFVAMLKADMRVLRHDIIALQQQQNILGNAMNTMSQTMTQVAVQNERINHIEEDIRDMQRGEGFKLPIPFIKPRD